jgi:PilZ domain
MLEHRKSARELTLKTGKLSMPGNSVPVDCAILNISDDGACILVPDGAEIPATFSLTIDRMEMTVDCCLRWKTSNRIGVSFDRGKAQSIARQLDHHQAAQPALSHEE